MLSKGRVAMTPEELTGAARNLAHGLGIPVYIRDGRIYQQGPGLAFLPLINKNQGIGELIETIVAATTANCPVVPSDAHGNNRPEPVNYDVQYEGTSKP